ncbi:MAG: hypothetical protein LBU85_08930 [Treponema sp.]|jgi:hypothetical protein|nr:hypothetical protein [Treponema sp.]
MYFPEGRIEITLDRQYPVNAIGIGNTDGVHFNLAFNDDANTIFDFQFTENGLYVMPKSVLASEITIITDASYIGRAGAGLGVHLPTAIAKEPSLKSTSEPRITLSGQVVPGAGGYNYRELSLDCRYKITEEIMGEITKGYAIAGKGYPYFIDLTDESYKLPFSKLYANEKNQRSMTFQGGVRHYLYSRRFEFEERF